MEPGFPLGKIKKLTIQARRPVTVEWAYLGIKHWER
jgi:hypothetical protein